MSKASTPIKSGGNVDDKSDRVAQLKRILDGMTAFTRDEFEADGTKQKCITRLNDHMALFKAFGDDLDKRYTVSKDIIDAVVYLHDLIDAGAGYNAIDTFNAKIMGLQTTLVMATAKTV